MTWHSFPKAYIFAINTFMISRFTRTNKLLPLQILWNLLFLPLIEMLHSFTRGHFEHFDCMVQRTSYCNNHVKKPATLSKSIPLTKSTIQSSVPSTENIWNKTLHALHYNDRYLYKKTLTLQITTGEEPKECFVKYLLGRYAGQWLAESWVFVPRSNIKTK